MERVVQSVWEQLKTCYDPEIPVNIVELGLVYECKVEPAVEGGFGVEIKMTLTAPGCGMGPVLQTDAELKIRGIPGVRHTNIELVLDPPWDPSRMSEAARLELGMM
jgi:probable FeS assembly SUF system protein SufT